MSGGFLLPKINKNGKSKPIIDFKNKLGCKKFLL
jgi:hypothetical protein